MYKVKQIKSVVAEITTKCQASCPMCSRNRNGGLDNPKLKLIEWTFDDFNKMFSDEFLKQLDKMDFCGSFGDPLMNNDLIKMCERMKSVNPEMVIRINTNGGIRSTEWWKQLYTALPKNHSVVFSIDGLEDTNHIYRIGTNFKKIIKNAKAFIGEGGTATWKFLKFKHNARQVEEIRQYANELGFKEFIVTPSHRFLEPDFPVYDSDGNLMYKLEPPDDGLHYIIDQHAINNFDNWFSNVNIKCIAKQLNEIYVDAYMHLYPCCFFAAAHYQYYDPTGALYKYRIQSLEEFYKWLSDLGGISAIDLNKKTIEEVLESESWQTIWDTYWHDKKMLTCAKNCGDISL